MTKVKNRKRKKFLMGLLLLLILGTLGTLAEPEYSAAKVAIPTQEEIYDRIYNGWKWFHVYCFRCHGMDAIGSNLAPNLRRSISVQSYDEFIIAVREGRLEKGMQSWKVLLDDDQIADIYYYVRARSDKVLPSGRPDELGEFGDEVWVPAEEWIQKLFTNTDSSVENQPAPEDES